MFKASKKKKSVDRRWSNKKKTACSTFKTISYQHGTRETPSLTLLNVVLESHQRISCFLTWISWGEKCSFNIILTLWYSYWNVYKYFLDLSTKKMMKLSKTPGSPACYVTAHQWSQLTLEGVSTSPAARNSSRVCTCLYSILLQL